jgi:CxxC-x17-CxxC domain-containing protein
MAYSNFQSNGPAKMYDVSHLGLKCAECGADIAQLPFEPSGDKPVYCRECNRKRKQNFRPRY